MKRRSSRWSDRKKSNLSNEQICQAVGLTSEGKGRMVSSIDWCQKGAGSDNPPVGRIAIGKFT